MKSFRLFVLSILSIAFIVAPSIALSRPHTIANNWGDGAFPVEQFQGFTSYFGYRDSPFSKSSEFHNGLDFAAPLGSPVRNWWRGTVTQISDHSPCGTMIWIKSGDWEHVYCHLQGYVSGNAIISPNGTTIREGQLIPTNAVIGFVGRTGRTTGAHLHWGLKYAGRYVDPLPVIKAIYPA